MGQRKRENALLRHMVTIDGKSYCVRRPFEYVERNDWSNKTGSVRGQRVPHCMLPDRTGSRNCLAVMSRIRPQRYNVALDGPTLRRDKRTAHVIGATIADVPGLGTVRIHTWTSDAQVIVIRRR